MRNFHRWCYVHLAVSTFSFLILSCWGIPFCVLGFIANVLFNPVLALFLGLSTLLFFSEICSIPNGYIAYAMEYVSKMWLYVLSLHTDLRLEIPCAQPGPVVLAILLCGATVVIFIKLSYATKNTLLIALMACGFIVSQQKLATYATENLSCAKEYLHIIKHDTQLIVVDPGCLGRYFSAPSYVQYTLIPHLIQTYGTHTIDHVILLKPGKLTFDAVSALLERARVKNLYIPVWQGSLSKSGLRSFMQMKERAVVCDTLLHRIGQQELTLLHDARGSVLLQSLHKQVQKGTILFNAFCICHTIDNQSVTFYPSNYTS